MIDVVPNAGVIALGKQGENQAVRVTLPNIRAGAGSILLLHQRSNDQKPYPVPVVEADGGIIWTVSSTDTAYPGRGQAELQWLGADGAVVKSVTYQTNIIRALTSPGAVPDEPLRPYTQAVAKDAQAAKDAAASATEAARSAEASAGQAGLSAATAVEAARNAEAIVGQAGQSAQSAQAAALAAAQNAAAAETAEAGAKQAQTGAEAARTEAQTAKTAAEKAAQEAKAAQAKAEKAAQGVAADREQIGANTAGLEAAKQDVTDLKAETARTARSLDYLWKKSKGVVYDTETVTGAGSSVTVPSGAMDYATLRMVGGMSQRDEENNVIIDAQVDEVTVTGKNLLDTTKMKDTVTHSGITYTKTSDGSYRRIGTAEDDSGNLWLWGSYNIKPVFNPPNYLMVLKRNHKFILSDVSLFSRDENGSIDIHKTVDSPFVPKTDVYVTGVRNATFIKGTTYNDIVYPAVYEADVPPIGWHPYHKDTYPIPQAVRDLCPDYGQGTAGSYNYIDFAAKAYYHVGSMSQDGTWTALATPEIIDLSAVWPDDDFGVLQVEAGGTINLHYPALDDGYELAVPSETEIMVDVAKVVETDG